MLKILFLAGLQGVAEFLPISSSGHLVIGQSLFGINEPGMRLDLMLHMGTLFSIAVFYRRVIWRIVSRFEWRYVLKTLGNPDMAFADVMKGIKTFLLPVWEAIMAEEELQISWKSEKYSWV